VQELIAQAVPTGANGGAGGDGAAAASGETPTVNVRLWDPSTQLRFKAKRSVPPRPDGAPNRVPARAASHGSPANNDPVPAAAGWGD
jgi:hypothetical protein